MWIRIVIRGHTVRRGHGPQGKDILIGTLIAHHANCLHREDYREGLPNFIIQPVLFDLIEIDLIRVAQNVQSVFTHCARAANSEPRPWERVTLDEIFVQAQLTAERPHLILEQLT